MRQWQRLKMDFLNRISLLPIFLWDFYAKIGRMLSTGKGEK